MEVVLGVLVVAIDNDKDSFTLPEDHPTVIDLLLFIDIIVLLFCLIDIIAFTFLYMNHTRVIQ